MNSAFKPTLAVAADFGKIAYPVYASPKIDGIRCSVVDGRALTRSLKEIPNRYVSQQLSLAGLEGLDGELVVGSPTNKTVYADTVSAVMRHEGEPFVTFFVFDLHDLPAATFQYRLSALIDVVPEMNRQTMLDVVVLEQVLLKDETELMAYEAGQVSLGYEGVILRSPDAPYKFGRSTVKEGYLLKVKRFLDSECEILGVEEEMFNGNEAQTDELGRTKRSSAKAGKTGKGTMGALVVRDIHTKVEFNIGTGFTAEQRAADWKIGSLHKYKFFPVGVKDRPRHPVYLGARSALDI